MVGGPYAHGSSGETGRTEEGTDFFTNNRHLWYEAEPAVDYSASIICALAGYASLQGPITDCAVRTPLTGRAGDTSNLLSSGELDLPDAAAPVATAPVATVPVASAPVATVPVAAAPGDVEVSATVTTSDGASPASEVTAAASGPSEAAVEATSQAAEPAPAGAAVPAQQPVAVTSSAPAATTAPGGACGGGGQPVCAGEALAGVPPPPILGIFVPQVDGYIT